MKKYSIIKNIVLFFGLLFIIDIFNGIISEKYFHNISYGIYGSINESLKSDAEILILGSSRAMHHYNPKTLSDSLGLSCYNSGLGGYGIFLNYAVLRERIKKHLPKIVILDLSPNVIVDNKSYTKLNVLLPYFNKYSSFRDIICLDPKFSKLELNSNLYIYNSTLYEFARNNFVKKGKNNNGYIPKKGQLNILNFKPFFLRKETIDKNKILYLNKIISLCKTNNIELIGIVSPTFLKFDQENRIINQLKNIFEENEIDFFDFSSYTKLYSNSRYFYDQIHMNNLGSDLFTKEITFLIKKGMY